MRKLPLGIAVLSLAVFLFAAYAIVARFVLHGPVTGRSLHESVQSASGSAGSTLGNAGRCRSGSQTREWRCDVDDAGGSGTATYSIRVRAGSSCWNGRLTGGDGEGGMPKRISGCVHRWQWSLFDLV